MKHKIRKPLLQGVLRDVVRDVITTVINPHGVPSNALLAKDGTPILTKDGEFILTF